MTTIQGEWPTAPMQRTRTIYYLHRECRRVAGTAQFLELKINEN